MDAGIQRGIIDTSQLQSPHTAAAQWGDVLEIMAAGIMCWLESYCRQDVANGLGQLLNVGHTTSIIGMNHIETKQDVKGRQIGIKVI